LSQKARKSIKQTRPTKYNKESLHHIRRFSEKKKKKMHRRLKGSSVRGMLRVM
jgi:hypothetical protein